MTLYTLTYTAGGGDCYGSTTASIFNSGGASVYVTTDNDGVNESLRAWFPFASVTLSKGTIISSATFSMTANATSGVNNTGVLIGCEAADNPANPANQTDLLGRTRTSSVLNTSFNQFTNGVVYSFDLTTAVQEVINRSGWANGNTLAVIIDSNDSSPRKRQVAAVTSQLVIVANVFVPSMLIYS